MGLIKAIFGTYSSRELKKIEPIKAKIEALGPEWSKLSEAELKAKTSEFKKRLADGETLDDILPEAFATVREAAKRVLGMYHFPVQLIGGIVLHQGRIAEMKTGEGKTLVATLPVYLNALTGRGVHLVTVNDYLATRDSEWMGKVYRYLGLSVGLIVHGLTSSERRAAYACDITYGTNNEFGFDYLRDNMAKTAEAMVQRELNFAIVDEVDSILIDEARTPLIISGSGEESSDLYEKADRFVRGLRKCVFKETDNKQDFTEQAQLEGDADYIVDEKAKSTVLTASGIKKAERFFGVDTLTDQENYKINHHINNALKAHGTMFIDRDYVVRDGEVIIVDDFTGRLMEGRRYSNGLHQAIEAKEGVKVERESKTLATITFQNYFRMYKKLSGMTGTATTEESEFRDVYRLDVVEIPTNKPMIREDMPDAVFKSERGKFKSIIREVSEVHATGQPILIGTVSVEKSELLSQLFHRAGIKHNVLNAKQHEREAEIVAQAGRLGAVTISTNMAGRGTDIILGGNPEFMAKQEMRKQGYDDELIEQSTAHNDTDDKNILEARETFNRLEAKFNEELAEEKQKVVEAGGLFIMGTERHESRRIDNQLRGRAGRQGDPGKSKFYLSFEDDILRLFGGEAMENIFNKLGVEEDLEIAHPLLSRNIESAQRKVEAQNCAIRKHVLDYDEVMNHQRELIYRQRHEVLSGADVNDYYLNTLRSVVESIFESFTANEEDSDQWDKPALVAALKDILGELPEVEAVNNLTGFVDLPELSDKIVAAATEHLEAKRREVGDDYYLTAQRLILLSAVDNHWMDHIDAMDDLRDSIGMRGYAQHDPVIEYKREGFEMFEQMTAGIQEDSLRLLMRAHLSIEQPKEREDVKMEGKLKADRSAVQRAQQNSEPVASKPVKRSVMIGRNDPCWCGSGKKYKNCHLREDEQKKL